MMKYLSKIQITRANYHTVKEHGGNFVPPTNFLHEDALDYLIDAVEAEMFGSPLYPTLADKASLYLYNIICNHIFQDGNKRTGLEAALFFLRLNDYKLKKNLIEVQRDDKIIPVRTGASQGLLFDFITEVASGKLTLEDCQAWIAANIEPINP
jgi:death on curing protein